MGKATSIAWTDHTFNPWWGCEKVSAGCANCYAETFSKRVGQGVWGKDAPRRFFGEKHWREPLKWDRDALEGGVRRRVFCASMADVFEDRPDLVEQRSRLFGLIQNTQSLDWLLLTKRPENIARLMPGWATPLAEIVWPNVWLGTSVENQEQANARIPHLLEVPAMVRFLSCEPLLGPVDVSGFMWPVHDRWPSQYRTASEARADGAVVTRHRQGVVWAGTPFVKWVIAGGESGPGARPCDVAWIRSLRDQCRDAGTAFFCKQLGARAFSTGFLREKPDWALAINGAGHGNHLSDAKGSDPAEWPEDLRVQEFPA